MMTANELMIGAFVYFNCFDGSKIVVRVTGFKDGIVYGDSKKGSHWCNIEKVEPIPLTSDILVNNGWLCCYPSLDIFVNDEFPAVSLEVGVDGRNRWWWHIGETLITPINYVHELQHILKLCCIEKQIKV